MRLRRRSRAGQAARRGRACQETPRGAPRLSNALRKRAFRVSRPALQVDALAALVARVAAEVDAGAVLDVGAGQGFLAQALALRYGLRVLALDAVAPLAAAADARGARVAAAAARCACRVVVPPRAVAARFAWEAPAQAAASLEALVRDALPQEHGSRQPRVVLVGLHACGDLTPNLCRAFAASDTAAALVVVGCCYNLLTEAGGGDVDGSGEERAAADSVLDATAAAGSGCVAPREPPACDAPPGFPLSAAAASLRLQLGRDARMLACQSGERWATPQGAPSARTTAGHVFRAAMDVVLCRYFPGTRKDALSSSREAASAFEPACLGAAAEPDECAAFAAAAHAALAAAGLDAHRAPEAELHAAWRDELAPRAHLLPAFCALRAALAALLESLIALDRLLFLREAMGGEGTADACCVLPVFDPARSPRNLALVARKPSRLPDA